MRLTFRLMKWIQLFSKQSKLKFFGGRRLLYQPNIIIQMKCIIDKIAILHFKLKLQILLNKQRIPPSNMLKKQQTLTSWAYNHDNITDPKYSTNAHGLYVTISGTIIFLIVSFVSSHLIFTSTCTQIRGQATFFGYFLFVYLVFMVFSRYTENGSVSIYQFLWACNQCLFVGAIAMITNDSHLLRASVVAVSVDQVLWYVDILGYIVKRKFIIGVAKYIIWPQTTKLRLMTTFHHVWYIPLVLWLVSPSAGTCGFNSEVFLLSSIMTLFLAIIGRISAPKEVVVLNTHSHAKQKQQKGKTRKVYLNLNLSWQLWKDVKMAFLQKCYKLVPGNCIPIILSMFWTIGNFCGFLILMFLQKLYS